MAKKGQLLFARLGLLLVIVICGGTRAQECTNFTTCEDCIDAACGFDTIAGCFESCDGPNLRNCFEAGTLPDSNTQETCQVAAEQDADLKLCISKEDCEECVATSLSDGNSTCQWNQRSASCSFACDRYGCGQTTCDAVPCESLTSCDACLAVVPSCAWVPEAGSCLESCDMIADAVCVVYETKPSADSSVRGNCQRAEDQQADTQLCQNKTGCEDCVATALTDGTSTCQWFETSGYCGSACDMNGCGATTCASCEGLSCDVCLDASCAWVPEQGCLESCDTIADTSCFPSQNYTAEVACASGDSGDSPSPNPTDSPSPNPTSASRRLLSASVVVANGGLVAVATWLLYN